MTILTATNCKQGRHPSRSDDVGSWFEGASPEYLFPLQSGEGLEDGYHAVAERPERPCHSNVNLFGTQYSDTET